MYTYCADDYDALIEITSRLLKEGVGFRAFWDTEMSHWVIELTGAF
jgi:hypothetical protein